MLGALGSLFAINSAIEVDLTGQINGESAAGQYVGTIGGQGAFARAALTSASGRSIVALPATARDGTISRIVHRLADGVVSTPRADADLVVTEHGVADLRGASLSERAARLLAIADPRHRDALAASPAGRADGRRSAPSSPGSGTRARAGASAGTPRRSRSRIAATTPSWARMAARRTSSE